MSRFDSALLRARRKKLRLTIEELSDLAGVEYASVLGFETGAIRPAVTTLEKLCRALSCDPNALLSDDDDDDTDTRPTDLGVVADQRIAETLESAPPMTERQAGAISAALFGKDGPA